VLPAGELGGLASRERYLEKHCEKNHELPLTFLRPFPEYTRITSSVSVDKPSPPAEQFRSLGLVYQLVSEFLAPIILGLVIDWQAGTAPWFTVIGVLLGMLIGGFRIYRIAGRIGKS
jgi:hypothetical protein